MEPAVEMTAPLVDGAENPVGQDEESETLTTEQMQQAIQNYDSRRQRFDVSSQLLGPFTVFCLMMNRTIGSGIFTQPHNILHFSGSSGVAVMLWYVAGAIILCITVCWIEMGLSTPLYVIYRNGVRTRVPTPRSGGDKNYLEYIFKRPKFLITCVFGIVFIVFGNLAGNAIQFGIFIMQAINPGCEEDENCYNKPAVLGLAILVLTLCAFINIFTRRLSIYLNNLFAVIKLSVVFVMVLIGLIYGSVHGDGCRKITWQNQGEGGQVGDVVIALFYAMYPYGGYEQPFYVLAEVSRPRQIFPKATTFAMLTALALFPLLNVSYLCMTPYHGNDSMPRNMAIAFFVRLAGGTENDTSIKTVQGVSAMFAVFIFGGLMAQTYTASRVKQEIAKEGILPWSLSLATSNDTIVARLTSAHRTRPHSPSIAGFADFERHVEHAPFAATFLHWSFSVLLVLAVGIPLPPSRAYNFLTYVKSFTILGVLGLLTVGGLLYLKLDSLILGPTGRGRNWRNNSQWQPYLDPLPAVLGTAALSFLLFAAFVPPSVTQENSLGWYIGPTVGWLSGMLGVLWWLGLKFVQWHGQRTLVTRRKPFVDFDAQGNPIQRAELVWHEWEPDMN